MAENPSSQAARAAAGLVAGVILAVGQLVYGVFQFIFALLSALA